MAESFSREKLRHAPQNEHVDEKSCVTPVGTSNEPDVQNEWEENTKNTWARCKMVFLKKNQNAPRPSEHPLVKGKKCQNV